MPEFVVGILSDDTILLQGQKEQGVLNPDEAQILLDYLRDYMSADEETEDED